MFYQLRRSGNIPAVREARASIPGAEPVIRRMPIVSRVDLGERLEYEWNADWSYDPNAWGILSTCMEMCMNGPPTGTHNTRKILIRSPQTDPEGPQSGTHRIMRGGAWNKTATTPIAHLTSFRRFPNLPSFKSGAVGGSVSHSKKLPILRTSKF